MTTKGYFGLVVVVFVPETVGFIRWVKVTFDKYKGRSEFWRNFAITWRIIQGGTPLVGKFDRSLRWLKICLNAERHNHLSLLWTHMFLSPKSLLANAWVKTSLWLLETGAGPSFWRCLRPSYSGSKFVLKCLHGGLRRCGVSTSQCLPPWRW